MLILIELGCERVRLAARLVGTSVVKLDEELVTYSAEPVELLATEPDIMGLVEVTVAFVVDRHIEVAGHPSQPRRQ